MRDDRHRWAPPVLEIAHSLVGSGVAARRVLPQRQVVISGRRDSALRLAGLGRAFTWPEIAPLGAYAVSLRRDRILAVDVGPIATGWFEAEQLAVSEVTDGYEVVEISGPGAMDFLQTGTELSLDEPSASVLRLWHGFGIMLYRYEAQTKYRIHVGSVYAEGLWSRLELLLRLDQGRWG